MLRTGVKASQLKKITAIVGIVLFAGIIGTSGLASAQRGFDSRQPNRTQCASIGFTNYSDCIRGNPSPSVCKKLGFTSRFDCIQDKPSRTECAEDGFRLYSKCINAWRRSKQAAAYGYGNNNGSNHSENDNEDNDDEQDNDNDRGHKTTWQWVVGRVRGDN